VSTLERAALMALRREIGFVFQFAALFDSMSVFDNVALGLSGATSRTTTSRSACARRWRSWT